MNVRFHSNLKMTDQFIAENASRITNHNNEVEALDSAEVQVMEETIGVQDLEVQEEIDLEKCLLQPVETVVMNVRFHSNLKMTDQFIAENASRITNKTRSSFTHTTL